MAQVATDIEGIHFGIASEEGNLITQKVSISNKTDKKDLRGKFGGYKALMSYNNTFEVSIEGAIKGTGTSGLLNTGFSFANGYTLLNDGNGAITIGDAVMTVEEITVSAKNEDFKTASIKLFGYALITTGVSENP